MVRLYLMRHGETVDNVNRILQGQTDGKLNDNGLRMAQEASQRMAATDIDVFFSSDLGRCVDTCRIMAAPHGKPIVQTPLLRERDWGSLTGLYIPDLKGREWPDDVETTEQMWKRAEAFLNHIRAEYQGKTLFVVGHGIINRVILSILSGLPMREVEKMANAEIRLLTIE